MFNIILLAVCLVSQIAGLVIFMSEVASYHLLEPMWREIDKSSKARKMIMEEWHDGTDSETIEWLERRWQIEKIKTETYLNGIETMRKISVWR